MLVFYNHMKTYIILITVSCALYLLDAYLPLTNGVMFVVCMCISVSIYAFVLLYKTGFSLIRICLRTWMFLIIFEVLLYIDENTPIIQSMMMKLLSCPHNDGNLFAMLFFPMTVYYSTPILMWWVGKSLYRTVILPAYQYIKSTSFFMKPERENKRTHSEVFLIHIWENCARSWRKYEIIRLLVIGLILYRLTLKFLALVTPLRKFMILLVH